MLNSRLIFGVIIGVFGVILIVAFRTFSRSKSAPFIKPQLLLILASVFAIASYEIGSGIGEYLFPQKADINTDISSQLKQLNNIEDSLMDLQNFVKSQKSNLVARELRISNIESRIKELQPALEINQEQLDSLLTHQNKYIRRGEWINRILAFFIGVLSSLIATIVYHSYQKKHLRK